MPTEPNEEKVTPYKIVAAMIYAEHPNAKEKLNNSAQVAIDSLRSAMPTQVTDQDLEVIFSLIAFIAGDLLRTPVNSISENLNVIFDTYTLAAGAVAGEIDLGDTSKGKEVAELLRQAQEAAGVRTDDPDLNTGQFL